MHSRRRDQTAILRQTSLSQPKHTEPNYIEPPRTTGTEFGAHNNRHSPTTPLTAPLRHTTSARPQVEPPGHATRGCPETDYWQRSPGQEYGRAGPDRAARAQPTVSPSVRHPQPTTSLQNRIGPVPSMLHVALPIFYVSTCGGSRRRLCNASCCAGGVGCVREMP